jgi:hypothetical protein
VALTWIRTHDWDVDDWRGRSACLDSDPDVFFPIGTTGNALEQIETAQTPFRASASMTVKARAVETLGWVT